MRTENLIVPFPAPTQLSETRELEEYAHSLVEGGVYADYDKLPEQFDSGAIEHYTNWLSALTITDPLHRERGAHIHYLVNKKQFIYPDDPYIGTNKDTDAPIAISDNVWSMVRVHSHPSDTAFSPADWQNRASHYLGQAFKPAIDIVSTPLHNYGLLDTDQTDLQNYDELSSRMRALEQKGRETADTWLKDQVYSVNRYIDNMELAEIYVNCELIAPTELFGGATMFDHVFWLHQNLELARDAKIGFYVSSKNGIYTRVTDELIDQTAEKVRIIAPRVRELYGQRLQIK